MSKYDDVGVVMIPSAVKAEKLYSVLPENGNGDFTHDRNAGTATRVNKEGLIETVAADVPRLDYPLIDGVVQDCPALLLEPSRTNIAQYSKEQSNWSQARVTTSDNQAISPDGTQNAFETTVTSDTNTHVVYRNMSGIVTSGSTYVSSIFVKKSTTKYIRFSEGYSNYNLVFNFDTEEIAAAGNSTIDDLSVKKYPNGWYRLFIQFVADTSGNAQTGIYIRDNDNNEIYAGDDEAVFIWGSQMELGAYETSYIPNTGTGSTTRNADVCDSAGTSAEFNDSEGVLYAEIAALVESSPARVISIAEGLNYENGIIMSFDTSDNLIKYRVRSNNITTVDLSVSNVNRASNHKICLKYKVNDFALWIDGFKVAYVLSGAVPLSLSKIQFSDMNVIGAPFYGRTKELAVFKTALTDSELEQLTSWDSFTEMATGQEYSIR